MIRQQLFVRMVSVAPSQACVPKKQNVVGVVLRRAPLSLDFPATYLSMFERLI